MAFFLAAVELFVGYILLTDRVPMSVWDLLWYRTTGYFSRSVPDPDKRLLRWAGGLMILDACVFLLGMIFLSDGFPDWLMDPIGYGIAACLFLAFGLPWLKPFQKPERDREWKEMVLDPTEEDKSK